jgi:Chlamydia polymorphic membrane protein (Chlamydia_PMP) repeat
MLSKNWICPHCKKKQEKSSIKAIHESSIQMGKTIKGHTMCLSCNELTNNNDIYTGFLDPSVFDKKTRQNYELIETEELFTAGKYVFKKDIRITENGILILEPGVILYFEAGFGILSLGRIKAKGNSAKPVVFDGNNWSGVLVLGPESSDSEFTYCEFLNGVGKSFETDDNDEFIYDEEGFIRISKDEENCGGCLQIIESRNVIISDTIFRDNYTNAEGGAIEIIESNLTIEHSIFENNSSNTDGGAIEIIDTNLILNNCTFKNNFASSEGGAISVLDSTPDIISSIFEFNSCGGNGGAVYLSESNARMKSVKFMDNTSENEGGGLYIEKSQPKIESCVFSFNNAKNYGGFYIDDSFPKLFDNKYEDNDPEDYNKSEVSGYNQIFDISTLKALNKLEKENDYKGQIFLLNQMARTQPEPQVRAKYWFAVASLYYEKLHDHENSLIFFKKTLEDDSTYEDAFSFIVMILTLKEDWKLLERSYHQVIKKILKAQEDGEKDFLISLWYGLSELYRTKLYNSKSAIESMETIISIDSSDINSHENLAELYYENGEDYYEKAIQKYHYLLDYNPYMEKALYKLYELYLKTEQFDKAWCISSGLHKICDIKPDILSFYNQNKVENFQLNERFVSEVWNELIIPTDEDIYLRHFYSSIIESISYYKGNSYKEWNLNYSEREQPGENSPTFTNIFFFVMEILDIASPELYLFPEKDGNMQHSIIIKNNRIIPFVVVGQKLLKDKSTKELSFIIGRELSYLRPEHHLLKLVSTVEELLGLTLATMEICNVKLPRHFNFPDYTEYVKLLDNIIEPQSRQFLTEIAASLKNIEYIPSIENYIKHVEIASHRTGFVITNDLKSAFSVIEMETEKPIGLTNEEKKRELFRYATSELYFKARKKLGISI